MRRLQLAIKLKTISATIFVALAALISAPAIMADHNDLSYGNVFPDGFIEATDGTQNTIRKMIAQSEYSVIVIWAVWCPFCSKELTRLDRSVANKDSGLQMIGLNLDDAKAPILRYKKKWRINQPLYFKAKKQLEHEKNSKNTLADILRVSNLPAIFIVNSQAEIVFFKEGWQPESKDSEYSNWILKISGKN